MDYIIDGIFIKYKLFLLVLVRVSGIFVLTPFFSSQNIPNTLKIGFSFILSVLISDILDVSKINFSETSYFVLVIKELMVGLIIGFICYAFFTSFYVLGQIVDMEIGFGMVNVIDPQNRVQVPIMGNLYYILAFLIFLTMDGHHQIIKALVESYKYIPIGRFKFNQELPNQLINILSTTFKIGFRLSSPVVVAMLLSDILLGILTRVMPQMNVFVVGIPLKILIGLLIICITIPLFSKSSSNVFKEMVNEIYIFFKSFGKG